MNTISKSFTMGLMMAAALIVAAGTSDARPKKPTYTTKCTCTCIAYDEDSNRWEGDDFTFDTSGQDCTIGLGIGCLVEASDGLIWGAYASCMGITRVDKIQSNQLGVLEPSAPPQPTPSPATTSIGSTPRR